jgi:hypothetical protein
MSGITFLNQGDGVIRWPKYRPLFLLWIPPDTITKHDHDFPIALVKAA